MVVVVVLFIKYRELNYLLINGADTELQIVFMLIQSTPNTFLFILPIQLILEGIKQETNTNDVI